MWTFWSPDEHQGCPCHAWHSPVHDSPTRRRMPTGPTPIAWPHLVCPINPTAGPLYLAIGPLPSNSTINPSCPAHDTLATLCFCFVVVVEHCPAHTDTFLSQQRLVFTLTLRCLCIPGHIGAGPCFCFVFSTQTLVLRNVFRAFLRLGMCTINSCTLPGPLLCRLAYRQLPACLLNFLVILPHPSIIHPHFSV
jgi:hypothetical protein